jgi:hypothetical protein
MDHRHQSEWTASCERCKDEWLMERTNSYLTTNPGMNTEEATNKSWDDWFTMIPEENR